MSIQTTTYKKRLRCRSELSAPALLLALTIADLRYEERLKAWEPLRISRADLASACHWKSERSMDTALEECVQSGWIDRRKVYREGRQRLSEYYLCDPTEAVDSNPQPEIQGAESAPSTGCSDLSVNRAQNLRSVKRKRVADDAAPRGGGGNPEQVEVKTASSASALAEAKPDDAEPKPKKEPSDAMYAQWEAERLEREVAELSRTTGHVIPKRHDPLTIACPETGCHAEPGEPCPGYKLRGIPHMSRRVAVYGTPEGDTAVSA